MYLLLTALSFLSQSLHGFVLLPTRPSTPSLFSPPPSSHPSPFLLSTTPTTTTTTTSLPAKHAMKKATKGHNAYRPKKSRPSDRNRSPVVYPEIGAKPPEFTVEVEGDGIAQGRWAREVEGEGEGGKVDTDVSAGEAEMVA